MVAIKNHEADRFIASRAPHIYLYLVHGNDSGLMHLAAAGCPTLGLFGASNASVGEYAPAGRRTGVVVTVGGGMEGISVEAAVAGAMGLIEVGGVIEV